MQAKPKGLHVLMFGTLARDVARNVNYNLYTP